MLVGIFANEFTFATVLTMCTDASGFQTGKQVHSMIIKTNCETHIFVGSSLLDMYAKAGKIQEARIIFETLPERDVVSCTAMISGYAQLGLDEDAISLFRQLRSEGMSSNYVTFASVLTALSGLAALDYGKQVHGHVLRLELPFYTVLQNSLIDMYSKCGNPFYSRKIFDNTVDRTTVSWNAMLVCYSKHGMGREAVELFRSMKEDTTVKPDEITLLAVLSGCSHGGMHTTGLAIFDDVVNEIYKFAPQIEHYACVVDMLGRAGLVDKAFQFIQQMPFQPTAAILGSMLGACRVHSNFNIGRLIGQLLLEIEPENAGNYIILSNLYASSGRWEDVRQLRELMAEKSVFKEPGRSWIELEQKLHTFHSGDRSHPKMKMLMSKLKELVIKFGEAGYVPDLSCVLHDVDDEEKEKILMSHSEKLALTLGLLSSGDGVLIRVMKNLRICVDCHSFAKFLSKVYGRDVCLRDKNRFHHIVDGVCSCGDYW